jgi:hypothetical protein
VRAGAVRLLGLLRQPRCCGETIAGIVGGERHLAAVATIEQALGQSRYFLLLASPEAAASKSVNSHILHSIKTIGSIGRPIEAASNSRESCFRI